MQLKYTWEEEMALSKKYREEGYDSTGSEEGLMWYKKGIKFGVKSKKIDHKNYINYYHYSMHSKRYERKGFAWFEKAAACFKKAAEYGNDLAMDNYALYLYAFMEHEEEALPWFEKAAELGLAVADLQLSYIYREGYCSVLPDVSKADFYLNRFNERKKNDKRQLILSRSVNDQTSALSKAHLFNFFCGYSWPETYAELPPGLASKWKYEYNHSMKLRREHYDSIAQGTKTVEMRLYDRKRQKLGPGHFITFTCDDYPQKSIVVYISALTIHPNFEDLLEIYTPEDVGFPGKDTEYISNYMNELYGKEIVEKYEVLAIFFGKLYEINSDKKIY